MTVLADAANMPPTMDEELFCFANGLQNRLPLPFICRCPRCRRGLELNPSILLQPHNSPSPSTKVISCELCHDLTDDIITTTFCCQQSVGYKCWIAALRSPSAGSKCPFCHHKRTPPALKCRSQVEGMLRLKKNMTLASWHREMNGITEEQRHLLWQRIHGLDPDFQQRLQLASPQADLLEVFLGNRNTWDEEMAQIAPALEREKQRQHALSLRAPVFREPLPEPTVEHTSPIDPKTPEYVIAAQSRIWQEYESRQRTLPVSTTVQADLGQSNQQQRSQLQNETPGPSTQSINPRHQQYVQTANPGQPRVQPTKPTPRPQPVRTTKPAPRPPSSAEQHHFNAMSTP